MSRQNSNPPKNNGMHPSAAGESLGTSQSVLVPLPDGRWLALTREHFDAALIAGTECMAASTPSSLAPVHEPLLDAPQAAAQLGLSTRWLEDCARGGIIPHYKLGRFVRFRASEVAAHCRVDGSAIP